MAKYDMQLGNKGIIDDVNLSGDSTYSSEKIESLITESGGFIPDNYYTKTETDNKFNPTNNFKTINSQSIVGSGNIEIQGGGGGTDVVANPELVGTEDDLEGLQVGSTKYKVPSGGSNVVVNPVLSGDEETATSIKVGDEKYVFPVVNTYGFTSSQITMFEGILRAGTYSSDQSANITAFIASLSEQPEPEPKVLTSITAVLNNPTVEQGQTYTPNATVTAHYDDSSRAVVTSGVSYSTIDTSTTGSKTLTISYTESGVTKTTTATVTVQAEPVQKTLSSISATKTKTSYTVGETFSTSDVVVTAHYSDSTTATVTTSATIGTVDTSTTGNKTLEISYTEDDITKTATLSITVGTVPSVTLVYKYGKRTQYNVGDIISASSKAFACTIGSADTSAPLIADIGTHAIPKGNLTHYSYSGENTKVHSAYYTSDGTAWHPMSSSGDADIPSEATYFAICVLSNDETTSASTYSAEIESGLILS